tara:strand:+ start:862 stop:1941 length:1080 start_codon:yes stop_codon:yes gene_type:complete
MATRERSVFVGNITYDTTEQQVIEILAEVGPVVSFKLIKDAETGKHKGYGFCQYTDIATAQSAIRNLTGRKLNGREIRVNGAASDGTDRSRNNNNNKNNNNNNNNNMMMGVGNSNNTPLGQPRQSGMGPSHALAVKNALDQLSIHEIYEVVKSMKMLVDQRPEEAKKVLLENPSLALALLQAQFRLGMVQEDPTGGELARKAAVQLQVPPQQQQQVPQMQQQVPMGVPPPQQNVVMATNPMMNGAPPRGYQYNQPPPTNMMQARPPIQQTTHIMQQPGQAPPVLTPGLIARPPSQPPQLPPPRRPGMPSNIPPQLIQQALSLSDQQIMSLAPEQRQALLQIRQQYGGGQQGPPPGYRYG